MATVGLDKLYYARITEDGSGNETYGTPKVLARAMQADLSVELAEATLYADDAAVEVVKAFKQGKITLGVDDLAAGAAEDLTGARIDENGVLVSTAEDNSVPVAIGFRARKASGKYRYFWLYRVVFAVPSASLQTKGDSITFSTPSIEGTVLRRNRPDAHGDHQWKAEVTEGETGVSEAAVSSWYGAVYEPAFTLPSLTALTFGTLTLSPAFDADVTEYTAETTNATNTITATAAEGAEVTLSVNGSALANGGSARWNTGSNTVAVTVTQDGASRTYTVTVTKGEVQNG
jgi:phi13 family phage major tail protein